MFHGSIVALVTPMKVDGAVDLDVMSQLIEWHIASGTNGIVVLGTTGESPTITHEERTQVIRRAVETAAGRIPVIAGTGSNSTQITIQYTQEAMDLGVDACLLVTPYYNKPTQEGLYLHFKTVAEAVAVPQILYNVPGRTSCDLLPETVARLSKISNIVGIKEASPDPQRPAQLMQALTETANLSSKPIIDIFSGDDINALAYMKQGAKGVISVTANVAPQLVREMSDAALSGNLEKAEKLNQQLNPLNTDLFVETNPIPTKWALSEMGKIPAGIRLPLTQLNHSKQSIVREALTKVGVL
ncbi:MAG: 4-hydroxy-tetrahydrodipicolinate synthase [Gammaproteobacteria bacterium]|nr:4-hydroxy-tetrahydrodipicolinate synthase [Gammaproteobacteria bacterium]